MPKIPTYTRQIGLTKEVPGVKMPAAAGGIEAKGIGELGQAITQIGQRIRKARIDEQEIKGVLQGKKRFDEILINATENPDIAFNEELHYQELQKAKEEAVNSASEPEAKKRIGLRLDFDLQNAQLKIKRFSYRKLIEQKLNSLAEFKADAIKRWTAEENPKQKQIILAELIAEFRKNYENKVLSYNDYIRNVREIKEKLPEYQAEWDIYQKDPVFTLNELQKGEQGIYKGLPQDKRLDLIEMAKKQINKIREEERKLRIQVQNIKENELLKMKIDGTLTEDIIRQYLAEDNGIRPQFADRLITSLRKLNKVSKDKTFIKLAKDMLKGEKTIEEIRLALIAENALENLSDEDFAILHTFNENITKDVVEKMMPKKTFLQRISIWTDEYAGKREEITVLLFKEYMKKINAGEEPAAAIESVIKIGQHLIGADITKYKIGDNIVTPLGIAVITGFNEAGKAIVTIKGE